MCNNLFGNEFDLNHDGKMNDFEKRAEFTTYLELVCRDEHGNKSISELNGDELNDLVSKSGIDPSGF